MLDYGRGVHQQRRRVRVRVHLAYFAASEVPYLFVNVVNLSSGRDVDVNVWFDVEPRVDVLLAERPLPVRLRPDESWEAWVEAAKVMSVPNPETRARCTAFIRQSDQVPPESGRAADGFRAGGRVRPAQWRRPQSG